MNIHTHYSPKPIPTAAYDWQAVLDSYDGAPDADPQPAGHGSTEQEAIDDLLEQLEGSAA